MSYSTMSQIESFRRGMVDASPKLLDEAYAEIGEIWTHVPNGWDEAIELLTALGNSGRYGFQQLQTFVEKYNSKNDLWFPGNRY